MRLQVGGQKLVSMAAVDSKASLLPRLDAVDEALLVEQYVLARHRSTAI